MQNIKQQLYQLCRNHIDSGIKEATSAIQSARDAAKNETKSSAGDKYETAREMMQQEINMNTIRIAELQKLKAVLDLIDPEKATDNIQAGSIARTSQGNYYVGVSIGKLIVDGIAYYTLTSFAPLGAMLKGKRKGEKITFNGKDIMILEVE